MRERIGTEEREVGIAVGEAEETRGLVVGESKATQGTGGCNFFHFIFFNIRDAELLTGGCFRPLQESVDCFLAIDRGAL